MSRESEGLTRSDLQLKMASIMAQHAFHSVPQFIHHNGTRLIHESLISPKVFTDIRTIPLYLSAASLLLLGLHSFIPATPLRGMYSYFVDVTYDIPELRKAEYKDPISWPILQTFRILATLTLLGLHVVLVLRGRALINIFLLSFFVCPPSNLLVVDINGVG